MMQKRLIDMGDVIISKEQKKLVNDVLKTRRITYGPMTEKFEKLWAKLHGVKYALFCNSGTSALQVALHALKEKYQWKDGSEVIMPATTFVATMNVILQNNLKPVFVDVESQYYNIDPNKIEQAITDKTVCLLPVHLLGQPAQMDKIMEIAKKYNLRVVEDSCETVGATYDRKPVGSFGDINCFSTYASHIVTTGVGGFCCTNSNELAVAIKGLYNHGRDGVYHSIDDDDKDNIQMIGRRFNFVHSGYSYRATEFESALGIGHMKRFDEELKKRRNNAIYLTKGLLDLQEEGYINLPTIHTKATHSFMLYAVFCTIWTNRDDFMLYLEKNKVMTRYLMNLLNQPIVRELYGDLQKNYPVSDSLIQNAFLIGCHPGLTKGDLDYVIDVFHSYFRKRKRKHG